MKNNQIKSKYRVTNHGEVFTHEREVNGMLDLVKNETENFAYLLFYHPNKVNENGDVVFHTDLVKMEISIKNAKRIFKEAVKTLEGDMPKPSDECQFCKWVDNCGI